MKKQLIIASILLIGLVGFSYRVAPWRVGGSLVAAGSAGVAPAATGSAAGSPMGAAIAAASPAEAGTRAAGTLTAEERKFAIDYYIKTRDKLLADVKGLSAAQVNWKADTSRWSVYQCTEHIALSENLIWQWIQMTEH